MPSAAPGDQPPSAGTALTLHMNALGEAVFALPLLHALKHASPPWRTVCVIRPALGGILSASGLADVVIAREAGAAGFLRLVAQVRKARPTICFALSTSPSNSALARISGTRRRIGYRHAGLARLLETVRFEGGGVENCLSLLRPLGIERTISTYSGLLKVPQETQEQADALLARAGIGAAETFIAVSPISTGKLGAKAYPAESWQAVCDDLGEAGWRVVLVGSSEDLELHRRILADRAGGISLAGKTPALVLAGVLGRAACMVGVDTGPVHIAASLGVRCVTLFGPSDPRRTAPCGDGHVNLCAGLDCQPCHAAPCRRAGACMKAISPADVIRAVRDVVTFPG